VHSNGGFPWGLSLQLQAIKIQGRIAKMAKTVKKAAPAAGARKPNAAFMKPLEPDEALAGIVGSKAIPGTEITKKLWEYIKKHKLQDPKKKTQILADENLQKVFGKKSATMFEMTKLWRAHVKK
jgi:chromatin remodeling complex protein RSC6